MSSSSSDRSLLSPSFHVNSCSAKAKAKGNSSGKECSITTAPGVGVTPATKTMVTLIPFYPATYITEKCLKQYTLISGSPILICTLSVGMMTEGYWFVVGGGVRPVLVGEASSG